MNIKLGTLTFNELWKLHTAVNLEILKRMWFVGVALIMIILIASIVIYLRKK